MCENNKSYVLEPIELHFFDSVSNAFESFSIRRAQTGSFYKIKTRFF